MRTVPITAAPFDAAGDLTLIQSTITGNQADNSGGGIYLSGSVASPGHFVLTNSIVAGDGLSVSDPDVNSGLSR